MSWKFSDYIMVGIVAFVFIWGANKGLEMTGLSRFKA